VSTPSATVLERILAETRAELERRKLEHPLAQAITERAAEPPASAGRLRAALSAPGVGVIAEFKRRSPSAGSLHAEPDLAAIVSAYERGGAVAVSILTEGPNFGGSLEDLRAAREACALPLLRKDFIVDAYQLHEARAAGADAVLLIVAALSAAALEALYGDAGSLGLDVLVEVHDRDELEIALALGADIIGINNRDLRDFSVDVERTARLMEHVPPGVSVISESGIASASQLCALSARGVAGVLVGEALMRAADPSGALQELTTF
jgi:indole-3-glycerol phosphate synthase